jgi:hypothetical protein
VFNLTYNIILVNLGQSWSILVNLGQSWSILVNLGQSWSILVRFGEVSGFEVEFFSFKLYIVSSAFSVLGGSDTQYASVVNFDHLYEILETD